MWFKSQLTKYLESEVTDLRDQVRQKDRMILELIDRFVNHKAPDRIVESRRAGQERSAPEVADTPSDAYSAAIAEAEAEVDRYLKENGLAPAEASDD